MKKYSKVRKRPDKKQWAVYSSKGKKLSRWYPSKKKATERLRQIEYFKNNADDGLLGISDIVDHNTYSDTLHVKSNDGIINKSAFGLTPAFKDTVSQGIVYDEELATRFFSGSSDPDGELHNSSPNINNKIDNKKEDKDLQELMEFLLEDGEIKEAIYLNKKIIKVSFDIEDWTPDIHEYIPDIDKETLLKEPTEMPVLGRVGNPLSVNQDTLLSGIGFVDRGMKDAEKHFDSISSNEEAMNILYQESNSYLDTNEEKTFAAFLYLMKNGKTCSSMVKLSEDGESVYTRYTINDLIKQSFASFWSDFFIPGLIVLGKIPLIFNMFPNTLLGRAGAVGVSALGTAFGPGGHVVQNISLYKLSEMICKKEIDITKINFKEGNLTYEES